MGAAPESDRNFDRSALESRPATATFALLLALVLALSLGARLWTLAVWEAEPERHFAGGVAASSTDSYAWFRIARELAARDEPLEPHDPLRNWPEGKPRGDVPVFAWLIARLARLAEADVYRTGIVLNVVLSSLFILPLGLWARGVGVPLAGVLGGFFGGLGRLYLQRTSVHRVDTDGGTLFFLCLLALAIGSLRPELTLRRNAIRAALAGLSLAAFVRWYDQPGFWLVYAGTFALQLAAARFGLREALRLGLVFTVCSNPLSAIPGIAGLAHFLRFYVQPGGETTPSPLDYASVTRDITELQPLPITETLAGVVDLPFVGMIGLAGLLAFGVMRGRALVPLLPVLLLGLYALAGPQRFGVFLGPLVGIGWGYALSTLARAYHRSSLPGARHALAASFALGVALIAGLTRHSGFSIDPVPRIPAATIASLKRLVERLPDDAALLASWGHGYLLTDVTGAATFTDGERPDPIVHYLFSRAITSPDPVELQRIVATLSTYGQSELHRALEGPNQGTVGEAAALESLLAREATTAGNVVLVLMGRDLAPFPAFFRTGRWDFARGEGPEEGYDAGTCRAAGTRYLRCVSPTWGAYAVDRKQGRVGGDRWLRRIVEIGRDGRVRIRDHAPGAAISLQLIPDGEAGNYSAHLLPESVFASNFNQLFFLGQADPTLFEEIHQDLPRVRAYRIRAGPGQETSTRRPR